jgi:hypothetical protein
MGHRDAIPEDPLDFLRWSRNFLIQNIKNAKRWNIPPFVIEEFKSTYRNAKEVYGESVKEPPPAPNPVDGFTIYWDKKKRFNELFCAFYGIKVDKDGGFDGEELARRMMAFGREERRENFQEFLMGIVQENAARYNMPPEWAEGVRRRMAEARPQKPDDDNMQQMYLIFYTIQ